MYHRIPLVLNPKERVLGAIREERLVWFADRNQMGKLAELDIVMLQDESLCRPTAIFQGLRRPLRVPDNPDWYDESGVVVCVCAPKAGAIFIGGKPQRSSPPTDSVFVAYLRQVYDPGQKHQIRRALAAGHDSVYLLFYWEWVTSDPDDPRLPEGHGSRFRERWPWP